MNAPSYEEVEKHFETLDLSKFQQGGTHQTALTAAALTNICPFYQAVRPFLLLAADAVLIPAKWRTAIKLFVQAMDFVCPPPTT